MIYQFKWKPVTYINLKLPLRQKSIMYKTIEQRDNITVILILKVSEVIFTTINSSKMESVSIWCDT